MLQIGFGLAIMFDYRPLFCCFFTLFFAFFLPNEASNFTNNNITTPTIFFFFVFFSRKSPTNDDFISLFFSTPLFFGRTGFGRSHNQEHHQYFQRKSNRGIFIETPHIHTQIVEEKRQELGDFFLNFFVERGTLAVPTQTARTTRPSSFELLMREPVAAAMRASS